METFFSIFVWFWFFVFVDFVFDFVTFWYLFYFVKCKCGRMFASPLWKSLLFLTHSSCRFSWVFYLVFYHFDIILFTLIYLYTRACSGISCSCVPGFVETSYLTFIANSTDWLPRDARSGCGKSRNYFWSMLLPNLGLLSCI